MKLTPPLAAQVNAHYDSAVASVGASDDAAPCGIMLELARLVAASPAYSLSSDVILLLNGAEETLMQAAHAFLDQHPWYQDVGAVINVGGCREGGVSVVGGGRIGWW